MGGVGAVINRTTRHLIENHGWDNPVVTSEHAGTLATAGDQSANRRSSAGLVVPSNQPSGQYEITLRCHLFAGLDGIQNRIDPGAPADKDLYELPPEELTIPQVPDSLDKVLDALEADYECLLKGDVFTPDLIEAYIAYKRVNEVDAVRLRPHPHEFTMYFDV